MNFTTVWGRPKDRVFGAGVDRGMVYTQTTPGQPSVGEPWNGLVNVTVDSADGEFATRFIDGVPFGASVAPKNAKGTVEAFTYPGLIEEHLGDVRPDGPNGIIATGQPPKPFNMTYREMLGHSGMLQDEYIIHILYGVVLQDGGRTHNTFSDSRTPDLFSWPFLTTVRPMAGMRPTSYFKIDTRTTHPTRVREIEGLLYGNEGSTPYLPTIDEIRAVFGDVFMDGYSSQF